MARSDWNQYDNADTNHLLSSVQAKAGSSSLRTDDDETTGAEVLSTSESDTPTESRIITEAYPQGDTGVLHTFHRFQDVDNYYMLGLYYSSNVGGAAAGLRKVVGGTETIIGEVDVTGSGVNFQGLTLSDGSIPSDGWAPYRLSFWQDSSGDVRGRVEEDADRDGTWTQIESDFVDTSPDLEAGGGVGIGSYQTSANSDIIYWDETEVFY